LMLKKELYDHIDQTYHEIGCELGWSLLYGLFDNMWSPKYPLAFLGLNPAGRENFGSNLFSDTGSSYLYEDWGYGKGQSPLQLQVVELFKVLAQSFSSSVSHIDLLNYSLAANWIPFRSAKWVDLPNKNEALLFSRELWKKRLHKVPTSLYVVMSKIVFNEIRHLLVNVGYVQVVEYSKQIGWGRVTYQVVEFERSGHRAALIRLPHLSRYKIFSRKECMPAIKDVASISRQYLSA